MSFAVSSAQLRAFVERIETLEEEKKGIADDIKDVYAEAKAQGFDGKTIKQVVKLRAMDRETREAAQALLETYMAALGMLADTPLGEAAIADEVKRAAAASKLRRAVKRLKTALRKSGATMTMTVGDKSVTV